jgi:2-polyprenyl-3-methyl-5-hydroxy-6-metoxy-1,4-benzoquinol methylase
VDVHFLPEDAGSMKETILALLDAVLPFSLHDNAWPDEIRVEWNEPASGPAADAIKRVEAEHLQNLPEKKKYYVDASLSRFRFVAREAIKHFPARGKVLDLGCAPGYLGIILNELQFEVHGLDLNQLWEETYPHPKWIQELRVQAVDVERSPLPFPDGGFDGVLFTEVLEHIAIVDPVKVLHEIARILKPNATLLLTTPNVCNLANLIALAKGRNIFWPPEIFYGGTDRHNREYTPSEAMAVVEKAGLRVVDGFLFNGPNNWNAGGAAEMYMTLDLLREFNVPVLGNTIFVVAQKP